MSCEPWNWDEPTGPLRVFPVGGEPDLEPAFQPHYSDFLYFAFTIAVAATNVAFVDWLAKRTQGVAMLNHRWAGAAVLAAMVGLEFATAGAYGLKTYSITAEAQSPQRRSTH